jgi:hypothetical protein
MIYIIRISPANDGVFCFPGCPRCTTAGFEKQVDFIQGTIKPVANQVKLKEIFCRHRSNKKMM